MSGGKFNYAQYKLYEIKESIETIINENNSTEVDKYGDLIGYNFNPETIEVFKNTVALLESTYIHVNVIDYLLSGDSSEESFLTALNNKLSK